MRRTSAETGAYVRSASRCAITRGRLSAICRRTSASSTNWVFRMRWIVCAAAASAGAQVFVRAR